jgi:hypothetical protein
VVTGSKENKRREGSRHFRQCLKGDINELSKNSKNKIIRDLLRKVYEFERSYQRTSDFVKYEDGDMHAESHTILNRWKKYLSHLMDGHGVSDVR